jgi:Uma2 family endonuclease
MATTAKHVTYDDLETIPRERAGDRHEIIDGELVVTPSPIPVHQIISANLFSALDRLVRDGQLGMVLSAPTDIQLTPDNVLVPDIFFIARDRLHAVGDKAIEAPPDLVVEILSPGTRQRDLTIKRELYARFGIREYWIVDPRSRSVTILALVGDRYEPIPPNDVNSITSRVLPDLVLGLDTVFAGITGPST